MVDDDDDDDDDNDDDDDDDSDDQAKGDDDDGVIPESVMAVIIIAVAIRAIFQLGTGNIPKWKSKSNRSQPNVLISGFCLPRNTYVCVCMSVCAIN